MPHAHASADGLAAAPVSRSRGPILAALGLATLVAVAGSVLGFREIDPAWALESLQTGKGPLGDLGFLEILTRNTLAALLLYSGVLTLGVSALGGLVMTSIFVGATMSVGVTNSGVGGLLGDTGAYLPFEFGGILLAGAAGLYPLIRGVWAGSTGARSFTSTYLGGVAGSLRLLVPGLVLILAGAAIEAAVLTSR